MPDPPSRVASPAAPRSAPTSSLRVVNGQVDGACRYQVREMVWGIHKRFKVHDTATNATIAIRTNRQIADSDLIRLNWADRGCPDSGSNIRPALNDVPSELIPNSATRRQCGRCRQFSGPDLTLDPAPIQEWWLCETCYDRLIGSNRAPTGAGSVGAAPRSALSPTASRPPVPTPALTGQSDVG